MAQILWLHRGKLVEAPPPTPVPLLRTPPPGWYGDRLRFFDGANWTEEIRPIRRPSSVMRVVYEDATGAPGRSWAGTPGSSQAGTPAPSQAGTPAPSQAEAPVAVGLLGLPPVSAVEPERSPRWIGLLGLPPALRAASTRRVPIADDVKRGVTAGLRTSRYLLAWAVAAIALVVVVGYLSSL